MKTSALLLGVALSFVVADAMFAEERIAEIPIDDFEKLHTMIKPHRGESPWREIPWVTNITQARQRAVAENIIFTAADGSPLGRT